MPSFAFSVYDTVRKSRFPLRSRELPRSHMWLLLLESESLPVIVQGVRLKHEQPSTFCCHQHLMSKIIKRCTFICWKRLSVCYMRSSNKKKQKRNSALLDFNLRSLGSNPISSMSHLWALLTGTGWETIHCNIQSSLSDPMRRALLVLHWWDF